MGSVHGVQCAFFGVVQGMRRGAFEVWLKVKNLCAGQQCRRRLMTWNRAHFIQARAVGQGAGPAYLQGRQLRFEPMVFTDGCTA